MKCPCGSGNELEACCQPLIERKKTSKSPEELMRSRYTAFCLKNMSYIRETHDPLTRHMFDLEANREWAESATFTKLEIIESSETASDGFVEFKAFFNINGASQIHHEKSHFRKVYGQWFYSKGLS